VFTIGVMVQQRVLEDVLVQLVDRLEVRACRSNEPGPFRVPDDSRSGSSASNPRNS
jgi:hypothetical protein